ncbi:MAG: tRNA (guanine-N(1)-)-methyltransferase [candidate division TM6 bacterium GW2011_GWF2_30_66]|jgi:tRNA (guanine37-N1)-methyltransferase|nr:MAG: tRNA (guanine-N(1)-)-methyltransferase [candidate division TM6 bacterium GW2011_GWF2_30_66]
MNISIISVFPEIYNDFLSTSLVRRAKESGLVNYNLDSLRSFVAPKERIDSPTFGPGSGMVIKAEVVQKAIEDKEKDFGQAFKVFFSPGGRKLDQDYLREISNLAQIKGHLMLLPARYEGMDSRVEEYYADAVVSIGDFVLMGGDLPAMVFLEGFLRLIPGVVGKQESVELESFSGPFVDYPCYGEPVDWNGSVVPEILRSGNHEQIRKWRLKSSVSKTVIRHFDWMRTKFIESKEQKDLIKELIPPHYAALMHNDVYVGSDEKCIGNTSVTSIDIHDIARSSKSFGIKNYFIVTSLLDQQKIVQKLLDFWKEGPGFSYNKSRFDAVKSVFLKDNLEKVLHQIEKQEGKKPLVIVTSAKDYKKDNIITYHDHRKVWELGRPVLFLFGTGQGLADHIMELADFILIPVEGYSDYNHLSVRSAAAIIFDRWLGSNLKK